MSIELIPLKKLTLEDVETLIVHVSYNSLRRAISSGTLKKVDGTDSVPTIYYILRKDKWSKHVLSSDLNRFMLLHSVE